MDARDAVALIEQAVDRRGGIWADLGAGDGTFSRALAEILGGGSTIYAVDRERRAFEALKSVARAADAQVVAVHADFTRSLALPGLDHTQLDGILLANALHFVQDADHVLSRLVRLVRPGGRVVIVEYDRRDASRWVPYPIPISRLPSLARTAALSEPVVTATRRSEYAGILYAAASDRLSTE